MFITKFKDIVRSPYLLFSHYNDIVDMLFLYTPHETFYDFERNKLMYC